MIKTKILKVKGDWKEVLNDCRFTVNKEPLDKEPSEQFKKEILIAEHSPIRNIIFKWEWLQIPHWVVVHYVRHKWEKFVSTQRTDRTGVDRRKLVQNEPQNMRGEANTQHLIDTMRKRLCYCASPETRECAESLKSEIEKDYPEIAKVLVPNCIYRGGCPEMVGCGYWNKFKNKHCNENLLNIQNRYQLYDEYIKSNN